MPAQKKSTQKKKLVVIDGFSLIFRAFHALPMLTTRSGQPTNAIHGFAMMLLKVFEEEKPDALVVALDAPGKTFRHEEYKEYKATRAAAPDELLSQIPVCQEVMEAFEIPILALQGYEADDVIGAVTARAPEAGFDSLVVTGDLDALQLVDDHTRVMMTRRGITDTKVYDSEAVEERFGIPPERITDFKALKGDTTDNIPGVPGIGDKTATQLLQEFGSIDGILSHLDQVGKDRIRAALEEGADVLELSKHLVTIVRDLPLDIDWDALLLKDLDRARIDELLERFELRQLAARLDKVKSLKWKDTRRPAVAAGDLREPEVVDSAHALQRALQALKGAEAIGLRVAASGDRWLDSAAEGIALTSADGSVWWIPLVCRRPGPGGLFAGEGDDPQIGGWRAEPEMLGSLLGSESIAKVGHDLKRDYEFLTSSGCRLHGEFRDCMIAEYLLNSQLVSPPLADIARRFSLPMPPQGAEPARAACAEAHAALLAWARLAQELERDGMLDLYARAEGPLIPILAEMEMVGVALDIGFLGPLADKLEGQVISLTREIHSLAGEEFNISSTKQLQQVLFEKLSLPRGAKTKTGYSTSAQVLEQLAPDYEIVQKILEYRELLKLKNTYADTLPKLVDPHTGRIHTRLNQAATATGRLSSSDPNLQNIPIRSDLGREIRKAFAAPSGHVLLGCDYSQIDLRVLAHLADDPGLNEAFSKGLDIHAHTASQIFSVPPEQVTSEMRRRAKVINFGLIYGMSDHRLATEFGITHAEAKDFIERYFAGFPNVRAWIEATLEAARRDGYVQTVFGRRRYVPDITSPDYGRRSAAERVAMNAPIQGTSSDIIKIAMTRLPSALAERGLAARMVLQVHDELLFEVPEREVAALCDVAVGTMQGAAELRVPLVVETKVGANWGDAA